MKIIAMVIVTLVFLLIVGAKILISEIVFLKWKAKRWKDAYFDLIYRLKQESKRDRK